MIRILTALPLLFTLLVAAPTTVPGYDLIDHVKTKSCKGQLFIQGLGCNSVPPTISVPDQYTSSKDVYIPAAWVGKTSGVDHVFVADCTHKCPKGQIFAVNPSDKFKTKPGSACVAVKSSLLDLCSNKVKYFYFENVLQPAAASQTKSIIPSMPRLSYGPFIPL